MEGENDNADSVSFSWVIKDRSITLKPSHQALPLLQDKKEIKSKDLYWSKLHSRESVTAKEMSKNLCPAAMAPLGSEWNKPTNHQWLVISRELAFIYFSCSVLGRKLKWLESGEREGISILLLESISFKQNWNLNFFHLRYLLPLVCNISSKFTEFSCGSKPLTVFCHLGRKNMGFSLYIK